MNEELRENLRNLKRTDPKDSRYPIDAYEDDLVALIQSEVLKALERAKSKTIQPIAMGSRRESLGGGAVAIQAIDELIKEYTPTQLTVEGNK